MSLPVLEALAHLARTGEIHPDSPAMSVERVRYSRAYLADGEPFEDWLVEVKAQRPWIEGSATTLEAACETCARKYKEHTQYRQLCRGIELHADAIIDETDGMPHIKFVGSASAERTIRIPGQVISAVSLQKEGVDEREHADRMDALRLGPCNRSESLSTLMRALHDLDNGLRVAPEILAAAALVAGRLTEVDYEHPVASYEVITEAIECLERGGTSSGQDLSRYADKRWECEACGVVFLGGFPAEDRLRVFMKAHEGHGLRLVSIDKED